MKLRTKEALKRAGTSVLCLSVLTSCALPFMGNKTVSAAEQKAAAVLAAMRDYSQEIEIPSSQWKKSKEKVSFIESNIDKLREEYKEYSNEDFNGSRVEGWAIASVVGEKEFATYIDFDDSNGYMVVGNNNELYDFKTEDDKEYLKGKDLVIFSKDKGFVFYDETEHSLVAYEKDPESEIAPAGYWVRDVADIFTNPEAYISANYSDYERESDYSIPKYNHVLKYDLAIYWRDTYTNTECCEFLTSCYATLSNWKETGLCPNLPSYTEVMKYDPQTMEPEVYDYHRHDYVLNWSDMFNQREAYHTPSSKKALDNIPKLYASIRKHAIELGYKENNLDHYQYITTMLKTCTEYGEQVNIKDIDDGIEYGLNFMVMNKSAQFMILKYSTTSYADSLVCTGFKKLTKEEGWWIFSSKKEVFLLEVDTHENDEELSRGEKTYIDLSKLKDDRLYPQFYYYDTLNN